MRIVHDINENIRRRRTRQPAHLARMTAAAKRAHEQRMASFKFEEKPIELIEIPIEILIFDHRIEKVTHAEFFKRNARIDSYSLVMNNKFIGNFGAVRGGREAVKVLPRSGRHGY